MCNPLALVQIPSLAWVSPFAAILLCIAVLPLIPKTVHWWENNLHRLLVSLALGAVAITHYQTRDYGVVLHNPALAHAMQWLGFGILNPDAHPTTVPGAAATVGALGNAFFEYVPFIVLLFSLYCISGGIALHCRVPPHPLTNVAILGIGGILANLVGTTGASVLLIRRYSLDTSAACRSCGRFGSGGHGPSPSACCSSST